MNDKIKSFRILDLFSGAGGFSYGTYDLRSKYQKTKETLFTMLLIKNAWMIDPGTGLEGKRDIFIRDGKK